ncbi:DUF2938 domain-containing protein [Pseudomonas weihenstephanensis]|uniref:DUF2938 domain-containing protein n=1 Tax=Pseudomonas weihenstephanensis TaxID=1608994 RepID=UPI00193B4F81|nr:DUF2938 domain-containing protein [Pseudomonas weihenstephanensis]MBM1189293.1 DUF2938 domain-containing protein [Pseudomonas weihenstephanensis]
MSSAEMIARMVGIGLGATLFMDLVAWLRKRLFNVQSLDYALVGRWLGHMVSGTFSHPSINSARPTRHERLIGWGFHYLTGVVFAGLLVAAVGKDWLYQPTLVPALFAGLLSVALPWVIMQPAFGMGIAAANTPNPRLARQKSLLTHLTFGLGLYVAGWLLV